MDNEQAKLILSTYRPGGEDASDPFFAEALDQTRHDPELGGWFAAQRRFDQTVHTALQAETPPPGLRDRLLLSRHVVRLAESTPRQRRWTRPASWLALAASIILLLGIGLLLRPHDAVPMTGDRFVQQVVALKTGGHISLGKMAGDTEELRAWLAQQGSPSEFQLPDPLQAVRAMGCQTFTIDGRKVSLVCFMLDKDRIVHFFVIDSTYLDRAPGGQPTFRRVDDIATATWSAAGRTYVVVGEGLDEETLRRLI